MFVENRGLLALQLSVVSYVSVGITLSWHWLDLGLVGLGRSLGWRRRIRLVWNACWRFVEMMLRRLPWFLLVDLGWCRSWNLLLRMNVGLIGFEPRVRGIGLCEW